MNAEELTSAERTLLAGTFLFQGVPDAPLTRCLSNPACTRSRFSRGEAIYTPARFQRSLGVLLAGTVQVTRGELVVNTLEAGDLFGAAALFHERPDYETTLTARAECGVVFFPQGLVGELLRTSPRACANYIRYLSERIHFLGGKIEALTAPGARQKLARHLLALPDGRLECSATELARRLDVGRASLYRAFEVLEEAGAIRRAGKTLRVEDRGKLQRLGEI